MQAQDVSLIEVPSNQYQKENSKTVTLTAEHFAPKKPISVADQKFTWEVNSSEPVVHASPGIIVEGYFIGSAYEFDSLTGHPGIRY